MKRGVIVVEGNIGVGKSTFSKMLADALGAEYEPEPDEVTNPYLKRYYDEPARWSFEMQIFLLSRRWRAQRYAAQRIRHKGGFVVMDRSYYGDVCFAKVQHELGYFDDCSFENYLSLHTDMKADLEPPALAIFLDASPETCKRRISQRMSEKEGRACESSIELSYLESLDREIKALSRDLSKQTERKIISWEKDRTKDEIQALVNYFVENELPKDDVFGDSWRGINGIGA